MSGDELHRRLRTMEGQLALVIRHLAVDETRIANEEARLAAERREIEERENIDGQIRKAYRRGYLTGRQTGLRRGEAHPDRSYEDGLRRIETRTRNAQRTPAAGGSPIHSTSESGGV